LKTGLLWFDDNPNRDLEEKVLRAAAYYERKYGQTPTVCFVNTTAVNGVKKAGHVQIRGSRSVLAHHFWIGIAEKRNRTAKKAKAR
jgi:hypothetical protein